MNDIIHKMIRDVKSTYYWKEGLMIFHDVGDEPAAYYNDKEYYHYKHGQLHCVHGPAMVNPLQGKRWFVNGIPVTKDVKHWASNNNIDLDNLSDTDKVLLRIFLGSL